MEFGERKSNNAILKVILCIVVNFVCFGICYYTGLPVRLEHVGSFYAAAAFGAAPAIVAAIISQLVYSLFYFGFSNILMLLPIILIILLIVSAVRYGWVDTIVSSLGTMSLAATVGSVLILIISLIIGRNFMGNSCWADMFDTLSRHLQYKTFKASLVTVLPYAILNIDMSWIISMFAYRVSPKQATFGISDKTFYKKRLQNRK